MLKTERLPEFQQLSFATQKAIEAIPKAPRYALALSGGLDSVALMLFSLQYLRDRGAEVYAVHVNHGLNASADQWQKFCIQLCKQWQVPLEVERVSVVSAGEGLEAAARKARYAVFERYLEDGDVLLMAHHQNDQAETVLMRLMRGAGPEGLAAIPTQRALGKGLLYRPLLDIPKLSLLEQAERFGLAWVEDDSNADDSFDRNFIRHHILPLLEGRWSTALNSLSQVAQRSQDINSLLQAWCKSELQDVLSKKHGPALNLEAFSGYDRTQQRALLHYWLDSLGVPPPSSSILERLWTEVIPAAVDAAPLLNWGEHQLRRYDGCLFYVAEPETRSGEFEWVISEFETALPFERQEAGWRISISSLSPGQPIPVDGIVLAYPEAHQHLTVRSRRGGEKIKLANCSHSKSLKKLLQEDAIPPWQREQIPLIFYDDELVQVGELHTAEGFAPSLGQKAMLIYIEPRP